jgi:hypothetical protein
MFDKYKCSQQLRSKIESEGNFCYIDGPTVKQLWIRHPSFGHLCGYIGIEKSHFLWGIDYNQISHEFHYHGGLTFSGLFKQMFPESKTWWFGFDCNHFGDFAPFYPSTSDVRDEITRMTIDFPNWTVGKEEEENDQLSQRN